MIMNLYENLGSKISEELQLRAEEKWILEVLEKIKNERNRLQIEALHLESLKAKHDFNKLKSTITKESQPNISVQTNHDIEIDIEDLCNDEELNLMVTDHSALQTMIEDISEEEEEDDEYEDSEEDIDVGDLLVDLNMLMFANKME